MSFPLFNHSLSSFTVMEVLLLFGLEVAEEVEEVDEEAEIWEAMTWVEVMIPKMVPLWNVMSFSKATPLDEVDHQTENLTEAPRDTLTEECQTEVCQIEECQIEECQTAECRTVECQTEICQIGLHLTEIYRKFVFSVPQ